MGPDAIFFFTLLFHFHQELNLFSSLLSAIRVVSSPYLRLLIFLLAILIPTCASSSLAFPMMYSAYKLNKQGGKKVQKSIKKNSPVFLSWTHPGGNVLPHLPSRFLLHVCSQGHAGQAVMQTRSHSVPVHFMCFLKQRNCLLNYSTWCSTSKLENSLWLMSPI